MWSVLVPLIAARASVRLYDPARGDYGGRARSCLPKRRPRVAAAVRIWDRHGRTRLLVFDFDAKRVGGDPVRVQRDADLLVTWVLECGGRVVVDRSTTSGGIHVYVPLAPGSTLRPDHLTVLLDLLQARLPSLDTVPLRGTGGAIAPPGTVTKEGGLRELLGSLDDARDTLITGSDTPGVVARLVEMLGGGLAHRLQPAARSRAGVGPREQDDSPGDPDMWEGSGDDCRLRPQWRWPRREWSITVLDYANDGVFPPDARWNHSNGEPDHSRARQSVLTHAILHGDSLREVMAHLPENGGTWTGFRAAYDRYEHRAERSMRADWDKACRWVAQHAHEFLPTTHQTYVNHNPPACYPHRAKRAGVHEHWLAAVNKWVDAQWPGSPRRWTVLAVLQAQAYAAVIGGEIVNGTPMVEVGGRSLSTWAGLLSETTVWEVLREVRDIPGAPLLHVRRFAGRLADRYALVMPKIDGRDIALASVDLDRVDVEQVHPAWSVLGLHARRIHELITLAGLTNTADVLAAAHTSRSAAYAALDVLTAAGLISRSHGHVEPGKRTLDDIATNHGLAEVKAERIEHHKDDRAIWQAWLITYFGGVLDDVVEPWDADDHEAWITSVITDSENTAPTSDPPAVLDDDVGDDADATAIALLESELGAVLLSREDDADTPLLTVSP